MWGKFRILRPTVESRPQNPELRNNPENFHPCIAHDLPLKNIFTVTPHTQNATYQDFS